MGDLPTIAIKKGDNDYKIINEKDFDEKKGHVLYKGELPHDTVILMKITNAPDPVRTEVIEKNKEAEKGAKAAEAKKAENESSSAKSEAKK
mgnify:CR=1 FL=1